ncbi:MAG: ArsR/SmtB family transcription factor [Bacteroidia bacterium]
MRKTDSFEDSLQALARLSKAIGHPARIAILLHLKQQGACTCQDIVDALPYSQSTVSGHLQKLKEGGYILMKPVKTSSIYSLRKESLNELQDSLGEVFGIKPEKKQLSLF